jgi:hypothetical protein
MAPDQEPNWQPISALGLIGSVIDGQLASCRDQHRTLLEAAGRPYILDDATVARIRNVFSDTAAGLWLYDTQLSRWDQQTLTPTQRAEVDRLEAQMVALHQVVGEVLALTGHLEGQTIETLLVKSDTEAGLEWLLRNHPD